MNKKILIANIFATLMLLIPISSVVGVSDVSLNREIEKIEDNDTITETYNDEDCGCQPISNQHLDRLERLLNRVEIYTNVISILSKHKSEITEKCEELSNKITTLSEMNTVIKSYSPLKFRPIYCAMLGALLWGLIYPWGVLNIIFNELQNYPKLWAIFGDILLNILREYDELLFYIWDLMLEYCVPGGVT